jgi:hypothetical protein
MATWWVGPESTYHVIRKDTAERWLKLRGTEELKRRLKKWFNSG